MAASCRFAFAVHILAVLASKGGQGVTSDALAGSVNTNPVVIRRLLTALNRAGLIDTKKGAGSGSTLSRAPGEISLDEIYRATEPAPAFAAHPHKPNVRCLVGRNITAVLDSVFASAQVALEDELGRRTLADVLTTVTDDLAKPGRKTSARARKSA